MWDIHGIAYASFLRGGAGGTNRFSMKMKVKVYNVCVITSLAIHSVYMK